MKTKDNVTVIHSHDKQPCSTHKVKRLGMLAWYSDCERREKEGQKQKQCKICGYWYWPDEM